MGSTLARPPSFEEACGGLVEQGTELVPQGLGQMGVDLCGTQAGVAEQDLDEADVDAALQQVCGEAVTQRVRPKVAIKAALVPRLDEGGACGGIGQVGQ